MFLASTMMTRQQSDHIKKMHLWNCSPGLTVSRESRAASPVAAAETEHSSLFENNNRPCPLKAALSLQEIGYNVFIFEVFFSMLITAGNNNVNVYLQRLMRNGFELDYLQPAAFSTCSC